MERQTSEVLLKAAASALNAIPGIKAEAKNGRRQENNALVIRREGKSYRLKVEVVRKITKSRAAQLAPGWDREMLLVTEYVPRDAGRLLSEQGISYVDIGGNCYIETKGLLLHVMGQPVLLLLDLAAVDKLAIRAFQEAGLRLIFALFTIPELLSRSFREISEEVGISRGAVSYVLNGLVRLNYVARLGQTRTSSFRIVDRERLIRRWAVEYADRLRPKLLLGSFEFGREEWATRWRDAQLGPLYTSWGGESGAFLLTGHIRPQNFTLYTSGQVREIVRHLRLVPAPEGGRVDVYKAFWKEERWSEGTDVEEQVVPPLIVYADLLASGDPRNVETAELIYERWLSS